MYAANSVQQQMESIIYGFYIRMNKLPELVQAGLCTGANASKDQVNIYIDMVNIMEACLSNVTMQGHYDFAVGILNMVAHYRTFFKSYPYNVDPMFYLVWSDLTHPISYDKGRNVFDKRNERLCSVKNQGIRGIINENVKVLQLISRYLPNVKTLSGTVEPHLIAYNNIKRFESEGIPNIVITKDVMTYQLPTISNTVIFRPKKSKGDDSSFCVTVANAIPQYLVDANNISDISQKLLMDASSIPFTLWPLVAALCPPKQTGLVKTHGPREAVNTVLHNMNKHIILGNITLSEINNRILEFPTKNNEVNVVQSLNNNWVLDVNYLYNTYLCKPESKDLTWNVVLKDINGLRAINDKIFRDTPVDFMGILN